jgi:hypothetical protein
MLVGRHGRVTHYTGCHGSGPPRSLLWPPNYGQRPYRALALTPPVPTRWPCPWTRRICRFIDQGRHTLFLQNERFQDMVIIECLIRSVQRGVRVNIMARPPQAVVPLTSSTNELAPSFASVWTALAVRQSFITIEPFALGRPQSLATLRGPAAGSSSKRTPNRLRQI